MPRGVITEEQHACLGTRVPLEAILAAIAVLPRPVTLFVEGTSIAPAVRSLLAQHVVEPGRTDLSGTIWPRSKRFHVAVSDALVQGLQGLEETLAEPEVADHLVAYGPSRVVLAAYDAGFARVWISRDLPPAVAEQIELLCQD